MLATPAAAASAAEIRDPRVRNSTTVATSSHSRTPRDTYSPCEWPLPAKSKAQRQAPSDATVLKMFDLITSSREDAFPWRYTTSGSSSSCRCFSMSNLALRRWSS